MSTSSNHKTWSDQPLALDTIDILGRDSFVDSVATRVLATPEGAPSTVFGLVGPWGSGKTSLLDRIKDRVRGSFDVVDFSPWASADVGSVGLEFSRVLYSLYGKSSKGKLRKNLANYAQFATPLLAGVPVAGAVLKNAASQALTDLAADPPWHSQFSKLSQSIRKEGKRALIVIDDVDRLDGSELVALLRVIRLLGRFDDVHYIIAYDQQTIENLLNATGRTGNSSSFMEKIVQFPFEVPPMPEVSKLTLMREAIDDCIALSDSSLDEAGQSRASELAYILASQISTPRTLARFRQQLLAFATHVTAAELDILDYIAVTFLRLEYHTLWTQVANWRDEVLHGSRLVSATAREPIDQEEWFRRISDATGAARAVQARALLAFLVETIHSNRFIGYSIYSRAFFDETYFSRYFLLFIADDDVSDATVADALQSLSGNLNERAPETALREILDGEDGARVNLAYSKAISSRTEARTTSLPLIKFLNDRLISAADSAAIAEKQTNLDRWIPIETGIALESKLLSVEQIFEVFGRFSSILLLERVRRVPRFRHNFDSFTAEFATYWQSELRNHLDKVREIEPASIGLIINFLISTKGDEAVIGILDPWIDTIDVYLDISDAFVQRQRWTGASSHYELKFRTHEFGVAVSKPIRDQYRSQISASGAPEFDDDLQLEDITAEMIRQVAVAGLQKLDSDLSNIED